MNRANILKVADAIESGNLADTAPRHWSSLSLLERCEINASGDPKLEVTQAARRTLERAKRHREPRS